MRNGSLIICFYLLFGLTAASWSGQIDSQVDQIESDIEAGRNASQKIFKKDARLVPVPIPIANPTIGAGLAVALLYLHPQKSQDKDAPTSTTGVFGMYTSTQSWAAGAIHDGYYWEDRIRFRLPAVHGEFNLDFYGIGNDSPLKDNPVEYNAATNAFIPRLLFELPWDNWYLGGQYKFVDIDAKFDISGLFPNAPGLGAQTQTSGLGLVSVYDSRNSNFWPSKGNWLELTATLHGEYIGGDYDYLKIIGKWAQYFKIAKAVTLVYRLDGQFVDGDAPFWDLSRIRLRGYAGGQLLDDVAVTAQAEARWNFYRRWTGLAFGGGGRIANTISDLGSVPTNFAGGLGLRFMLVEAQKLSIGLDVAYAEGGNVAVYFQVGDWLAN
jgi:hypothetical protein